MTTKQQTTFDSLVPCDQAAQRVMFERVLGRAREFYKVPENLEAFEAWRQNKEELTYGTNNQN